MRNDPTSVRSRTRASSFRHVLVVEGFAQESPRYLNHINLGKCDTARSVVDCFGGSHFGRRDRALLRNGDRVFLKQFLVEANRAGTVRT